MVPFAAEPYKLQIGTPLMPVSPPVGHIPSSVYSSKPTLSPSVCPNDKFRNDKGNAKLIHDHGELGPRIHELQIGK